uniref:Uncharacterized protein n=1 Tax=Macrostomum lignano TaxID=282301 RepID=A0A1I8FD11_9PLAT
MSELVRTSAEAEQNGSSERKGLNGWAHSNRGAGMIRATPGEIGLHEMRRKSESDDTRFEAVANVDGTSSPDSAFALPNWDQLAKLRPMLEETCAVRTCRSRGRRSHTEPAASSSRLISVQPRPAGSSRTFAVNINSGRRRRRQTIKATTNPRRRERLPCRPRRSRRMGCRSTSGCQTGQRHPSSAGHAAERADHRVRRASGDDTAPIPPRCAAELAVLPIVRRAVLLRLLHLALTAFQDWLDFFLPRLRLRLPGRLMYS